MATFKVGQRVRIKWVGSRSAGRHGARAGMTATIVAIPGADRGECDLSVDGLPDRMPGARLPFWAAKFSQLEPLTDPGVDQMIERLTRPVPFIQQLKDKATLRRKVHNEGEKA